ncbi:MAG TPA: hypothetical protein EYQ31_08245, partial [Candidatus Handelsmanbacteria bacterium]|nr:hypothetical protein [Candidatus Handelsmanbacteria bacterium]
IPFYGVAVCCTDHPEVQSLVGKVNDRRVLTYGFNPQADVRAENLRYENGAACFDVELKSEDARIDGLCLPMPGDHNVMNMLAAIAVARHLGIGVDDIKTSVTGFRGVNRRFTRVGVWSGVTIIDDYAHPPVEITAVLKAAAPRQLGDVLECVEGILALIGFFLLATPSPQGKFTHARCVDQQCACRCGNQFPVCRRVAPTRIAGALCGRYAKRATPCGTALRNCNTCAVQKV